MTRWFTGLKPGVGPVLKVMKDDADDPLTTPSTDHAKYVFDSEWAHKLGYVYDIMEINHDLTKWPKPGGDGYNTFYEPPGSNYSTALFAVYSLRANGQPSNDGGQAQVLFPEKLGFSYTPLIETRKLNLVNNRFDGTSNRYTPVHSRSGGSYRSGYVEGRLTNTTWFRDYATLLYIPQVPFNRRCYSLFGFSFLEGTSYVNFPPATNTTYTQARQMHSVFELPIDNVPMPAYASTPVEGQKVLRIAPDGVKMAYPGHDVGEGSHEAFIFNSDRVPAKIIGAGQVPVYTGGYVDVPTKFPVTAGTYVDFIVKRFSEAQFYHPPFLPAGTSESNRIELSYEVPVGQKYIRLFNTGDQHFDIRYMVFADDNSLPTTGGSKVFHKGNDGAVDYIQLKSPGSSDTAPGLNEIILDTRLPTIPIIAEGWLAPGDFGATDNGYLGNWRKVLSFSNPGGNFYPFPKMIARWSDGSNRSPVNRTHRIFGSVNNANLYNNQPAGCSINCKIFDDQLHVYHSSGNPWRIELDENQIGNPYGVSPQYGPGLEGIRYYIFAIPKNV